MHVGILLMQLELVGSCSSVNAWLETLRPCLLCQTPELPFHASLKMSSVDPLTTFLNRWGCISGRSFSFVLKAQSNKVTQEWQSRLRLALHEGFQTLAENCCNLSALHTQTHTPMHIRMHCTSYIGMHAQPEKTANWCRSKHAVTVH